jgi:ketosteroid isomerase-like protein
MKMRLLGALAALAIGFAAPAIAQEKEVTDPEIRLQLDRIDRKFDEACNRSDAAAVAALFTQNAVDVTPTGVFSGQQAIEKYFEGIFQKWHISGHKNKLDHVYELGSHLCAIGEWSLEATSQPAGGYWTLVYSRDGDNWKIRAMVTLY